MMRISEWTLAVIAAVLCLGGAANIWLAQASSNPWPLPALILIEIAVLGLGGFVAIALASGQYSPYRGIGPWIACGGLAGLAILGAMSVSVIVLSAVPALLFGGAALLADIRQHRKVLADVGILATSAVANLALVFALISLARI